MLVFQQPSTSSFNLAITRSCPLCYASAWQNFRSHRHIRTRLCRTLFLLSDSHNPNVSISAGIDV